MAKIKDTKSMTTQELRDTVRKGLKKCKSAKEVDGYLDMIKTWKPLKSKDENPGYTVRAGLYRDVLIIVGSRGIPMSNDAKVFMMDILLTGGECIREIPRRLFF